MCASAIDKGILLEAGTNEVEVLVFRVAGQRFGVNVAKVREVLPVSQVSAVPECHPAVEGVVRIREHVVPLVHLRRFLDGPSADAGASEGQPTMLLLEFSGQQVAYRVEAVERIFRVSWNDTVPLPPLPRMQAPVTSVIVLDGDLVPLIDFETVAARVGGDLSGQAGGAVRSRDASENGARAQCDRTIVFVDDSLLVREMLRDVLSAHGYSQIREFADGQAAWDFLAAQATARDPQGRPTLGGVISDIEMPRMDGFNLARRIRQTPGLTELPVILFSSLISEDNAKKGRQVEASAQVAKPRYDELVAELDRLVALSA